MKGEIVEMKQDLGRGDNGLLVLTVEVPYTGPNDQLVEVEAVRLGSVEIEQEVKAAD